MFAAKKTVIFITRSKVKITNVTLGKKPKETLVGEFEWSSDNFVSNLEKYRKNIGSAVRILLGEDFVYVVTLIFPSGVILSGELIREKAQELIPQDLKTTIWDYKEISDISSENSRKIQVAATVKDLFENLSKLIAKANLHIETIEPLSFSLARFTKNQEKPILFVYIFDKAYLVLAIKEIVLLTLNLDLPINKKRIDKFIAFAKNQSQVILGKIVFCGKTEGFNLKDYESKDYKTEIQDLSPSTSLAYKKLEEDHYEKELSLELMKDLSFSSKTPIRKHSSHILLVGIFFLVGVVICEIVFYLFLTP